MDQFEDIEIYPVEASERGDNAYYLEQCPVTHIRPGYAACLKKITDRKGGRLESAFADCSAAIGKRECPALRLRDKELKEGKALFYINRNKLRGYSQYRDEMNAQRLAALASDGKSGKKTSPKPAEPQPQKTFVPSAPHGGSDYAAAINRALAEEAKKPAPPAPKPAPAVKPAAENPAPVAGKAGMSLIELARLQFAAQAAQ